MKLIRALFHDFFESLLMETWDAHYLRKEFSIDERGRPWVQDHRDTVYRDLYR